MFLRIRERKAEEEEVERKGTRGGTRGEKKEGKRDYYGEKGVHKLIGKSVKMKNGKCE